MIRWAWKYVESEYHDPYEGWYLFRDYQKVLQMVDESGVWQDIPVVVLKKRGSLSEGYISRLMKEKPAPEKEKPTLPAGKVIHWKDYKKLKPVKL